MRTWTELGILMVFFIGISTPVFSVDWKEQSGGGRWWHGDYKEDYWDGPYKVKLEAKRDEFKEEVKCEAFGEPGLPRKFVRRGRTITVKAVLRTWRETGKCRHGSPEMNVRKHGYEVATDSDGIMKLYFESQARGGRAGARWWLFSVREAEEDSVSI